MDYARIDRLGASFEPEKPRVIADCGKVGEGAGGSRNPYGICAGFVHKTILRLTQLGLDFGVFGSPGLFIYMNLGSTSKTYGRVAIMPVTSPARKMLTRSAQIHKGESFRINCMIEMF